MAENQESPLATEERQQWHEDITNTPEVMVNTDREEVMKGFFAERGVEIGDAVMAAAAEADGFIETKALELACAEAGVGSEAYEKIITLSKKYADEIRDRISPRPTTSPRDMARNAKIVEQVQYGAPKQENAPDQPQA